MKSFRVILYLFMLLECLSGCSPNQPVEPVCSSLAIQSDETLRAGEETTVTVLAPGTDGAQIKLIVTGSYGARVLSGVVKDGTAKILLPSIETRVSGLVDLKAVCDSLTASVEMDIIPGAMVEPLRPLVGARSIVADDRHWSMAVMIPTDRFGNPVQEGTRLQVRVLHPSSNLEQYEILTEHLLGWSRIYSDTVAGKTRISVTSEHVSGLEGILLEVPGPAVPFSLHAEPPELSADGNSWLILRSDVLKDQYDNVLLDGTLVTFNIEMGDGKRHSIPAYTINGIAEAPLQAPDREQIAVVRGFVQNVRSFPMNITFTPSIPNSSFPIQAKMETERGLLILTAGPILGSLSQYVPDGTPVSFSVIFSDEQILSLESITETGYASLEISLGVLGTGRFEIKVSAGSGFGNLVVVIP